jgi:hypothetical protein
MNSLTGTPYPPDRRHTVYVARADNPSPQEAFLWRLAGEKFYGVLIVKYEAGRITLIKTEQKCKLSEMPGGPGDITNGT